MSHKTPCFSLGPIILVVEMIKVSGRHAHDSRDAPLDDRAAHALVASFQAARPCAPWSWWQASVADQGAAGRTTRGTPRQRVGRQAHDHRLLSSCAPEVDGLHTSVFAPPTARAGIFPSIVRCARLERFCGMIRSTLDGQRAGGLRCPTRRHHPGRDEQEGCHDRTRAAGVSALRTGWSARQSRRGAPHRGVGRACGLLRRSAMCRALVQAMG